MYYVTLNKAYPLLTSAIFKAIYSGVFVIHASHTVCVNFFQRTGIIGKKSMQASDGFFLKALKKAYFIFQTICMANQL